MMYYSSYDSPYNNAYTLNPMDPVPRVDPYADDAVLDVVYPDDATQSTQLNSQDYATQSSEDLWGCLMPLSSQDDARRIDLFKTAPRVAIGRSRKNTHRLSDTYVSSRHFSLEWHGENDVRLHNFSANGIMVGNEMMPSGTTRHLENGSQILFGDYTHPYKFIFRLLTQDKLGDFFEQYDLIKLLGQGTFGTVYKALSRRTGRCHAIKQLRGSFTTNKDRQMAATEIEILTTLDHPYIIKFEEAFYSPNIYIVLEYAGQGDLLGYLFKNSKVVDEPMAQHMAYQLCSALEYMHKRGIVHRDLKPENVLVTSTHPEMFKVADFGLSRITDVTSQFTTFCGSPCFMAPELHALRISDQADTPDIGYTKLVDSWAFGQIVYEFFAGRHMIDIYEQTSDAESKRLKERYTPRVLALFNEYYKKLSEGARDFLQQLLQPNPRHRLSIVNAMNHCWMKKYEPPVFSWGVNGGRMSRLVRFFQFCLTIRTSPTSSIEAS
ncbi:kinase-like protein [Hymenopellis radicata]|nr:kinase-like protein [Hymenopellis radicata]